MKGLKLSGKVGGYFIEALIVAFGVFLGILVSEWNSSQKAEKKLDKTISYIIIELESNKEAIDESLAYHEMIKIGMDSIFPNMPKDLFMKNFIESSFRHHHIPGWKGFKMPGIKTDVYESAKIGGILQELDIQTLQTITKVYQQQEKCIQFSETIMNRALNMGSDTKVLDVLGMLELTTTDFLSLEKRVSQTIEETITALKKTN